VTRTAAVAVLRVVLLVLAACSSTTMQVAAVEDAVRSYSSVYQQRGWPEGIRTALGPMQEGHQPERGQGCCR
jgi:outer membrane biogenesis lipoprotein LolB